MKRLYFASIKRFTLLVAAVCFSLSAFAAAPENLYLLGAVSDNGTMPAAKYDWTGYKFEKDGDTYTLKNIEFFASFGAQSEFIIALDNGSLNNIKNKTFCEVNNNPLVFVDGTCTAELKRFINPTNPSTTTLLAEPGKYDVTLEYSPATDSANDTALLKLEKVQDIETGVANPEVADGAHIEYFTLTGIKVSAPTLPGLYICRQGNKVWKELIRK
ncbi:MAG: hypothetical protein HDS65_09045 [Bacteroidales bacterium]|nr:hypothetical protein [Bacteroidales bacterium]